MKRSSTIFVLCLMVSFIGFFEGNAFATGTKTPICTRLLEAHSQILAVLEIASSADNEDLQALESAFFKALRTANIRVEDIDQIEYDEFIETYPATHKFALQLVGGTKATIEIQLVQDQAPVATQAQQPAVSHKPAELKDLAELVKALVPDDEYYSVYLEREVRDLIENRSPEKKLVGDIALQALATLKTLDYVYVDPNTSGGGQGYVRGWMPGKKYDETWGRGGRSGGKTLGGTIDPKLYGVSVKQPLNLAIRKVEELGYRWNAEQRRFDQNSSLAELEFKRGMEF